MGTECSHTIILGCSLNITSNIQVIKGHPGNVFNVLPPPRISWRPSRSVISPCQKKTSRSMKSGWKSLAPPKEKL